MFSDNYEIVMKWLENQIRSNKSEQIFSNEKTAIRAFKKLDQNLAVLDQDRSDLDHFISVHLNKIGIVKLKTTIRIYKKRQAEKNTNSTLLQCTLYAMQSKKLDELVSISGLTKMYIINQLIGSADPSDFAKRSASYAEFCKRNDLNEQSEDSRREYQTYLNNESFFRSVAEQQLDLLD